MSAEYIMAEGDCEVILCERGIRTYEKATRNTLDLSAIPVLRSLTHLPIIVDPSHGTGKRFLIEPMSKAALVAGAHGVMMEVHHNPDKAYSDGAQSLSIPQFRDTMTELNKLIGRIDYANKHHCSI
jgi:3-deoxy-7-phosphoheptulonate synthase